MNFQFVLSVIIAALLAGCQQKSKSVTKNCTKFHACQYQVKRHYMMPVEESRTVAVNRTGDKQEETEVNTGEKSIWLVEWKDSCTYELSTIVSLKEARGSEPSMMVSRNDGPVCEIIATSADYFIISQKHKGSKKPSIDTCWLIK